MLPDRYHEHSDSNISIFANGNDHVETPKINIGITDCVNTKPTIEKRRAIVKKEPSNV